MKVHELIAKLQECSPVAEVVIPDGLKKCSDSGGEWEDDSPVTDVVNLLTIVHIIDEGADAR